MRLRHARPADPAGLLLPAGWYFDPTDGTQQRWWDGNCWTERTKPVRRAGRL